MSASASANPTRPGPELLRQTVVIIGGSAGIGLETARRARAEGASIILIGRNRERLEQAARELGAERTAAFDANDAASLRSFFQELPSPIDHVMVTAGAPHYGPPLEMSPEDARQGLTEHLLLALNVARSAVLKVRPAGSLIFVGGTGARRPRLGLAIVIIVSKCGHHAGRGTDMRRELIPSAHLLEFRRGRRLGASEFIDRGIDLGRCPGR